MPISPPTAELWNLQKPTVPTRSRLFHLQPIGIRTLFAESLMGYVVRLANYHCVTPRQLVFKEIAPHMVQKGYPAIGWQRIKQVFKPNSPLIKGNELEGAMTTALIQALEELTLRQDLSQLTLLRQATALFAGGQLRNHQAWCPRCLTEWQQAGRIIYTPLIWLLKDLKICPQHRTQELIYRCPHCQRSFPPLAETLSPGFCPRCRGWLGNLTLTPSHQPSDHEDSEWSAFLPDPLEWQLMWLDDSEKLLSEAKQPFYPPKLACLSDLNLYSSQLKDSLSAV
jgi:TniQ